MSVSVHFGGCAGFFLEPKTISSENFTINIIYLLFQLLNEIKVNFMKICNL
jgi:hypothetical protein